MTHGFEIDPPARGKVPRWVRAAVTMGPFGRIRHMPGTWGSLAACFLAAPVDAMFGTPGLLIGALLVFLVGVWLSDIYEAATGHHDTREIVIDEWAAQWWLLAIMPFTPQGYALGFLIFRYFDIHKPGPISKLDEKVPGGLGVMIDDMLAATIPLLLILAFKFLAPFIGMEALFAWIYYVLSYDVFA